MAKRINAKDADYQIVECFGVTGIFTESRIDRDTVPLCLSMYEIRDGGSDGDPAEIAEAIAVDFLGTLLTKEEINVPQFITPEDDWEYLGDETTLQDFVR